MTLSFSVCLFYTFNSFQSQQAIMEMSESQSQILSMVSMFMNFLSVFVAIVLAFLILYANNFLIRRRKKEFGLYMMLGMPKNNISKVLIYETFFIGLLSLVLGLFLGIALSQVLSIITAALFDVTMNYGFIFSTQACILTMISFSVIFIVVMLFNTRILNKYKLIDLLHSTQKQEKKLIMRPVISVLLFIISILMLSGTYYLATVSIMSFATYLPVILVVGSIGTLLFFMSLSGFLIQFISRSKKLYYRNLNMFVLRQIAAKINTNFVSMSVVCLMLLLSIGALATGFNLDKSLKESLSTQTPYAYSFDLGKNSASDEMIKASLSAETKAMIKEDGFVRIYENEELPLTKLSTYCTKAKNCTYLQREMNSELMSLSQANQILKEQGKEMISLNPGEIYFVTSLEQFTDLIDDIRSNMTSITLQNQTLKLADKEPQIINVSTSGGGSLSICGIVEDSVLQSMQNPYVFYNVKSTVDGLDTAAFQERVINEMKGVAVIEHSYSQEEIITDLGGMGIMFTYIGIYLGIVFLIASAVILALQQLSHASDTKSQYLILSKVGAEKKMVNHAVFLQVAMYFLLPLGLAIIHSFYGIQAVASGFSIAFGLDSIVVTSLLGGGIIVLIYGIYFLITYAGYKNILYQE